MSGPVPTMLTPGTILAPAPARLRLMETHLSRPIVITGGSGGGKTKLLELLCRQLAAQGVGFTYIDPHGDGAEAVLRYLSVSSADPARVHYVKPRAKRAARIDPFAHVPKGLSPIEYADWLKATADRLVGACLRGFSVADQEIMARLQSWLRVIFFCCGIDVRGRRLGLGRALLFTKPDRPEFQAAWDTIGPRVREVDPDTFYEIEDLRGKSDANRDRVIESSRNCIHRILRSTVVKSVFGAHAPESLDPRRVILGSEILLCNLRKTSLTSRQQMNVLGGILANLLMGESEALAEELPFERRVPHFLIIDEAENFVGEDIRMGFAELRKFRMPLCLAFQDINCLLRGDLDLVSKAFGNAGLLISFCQQDVESVEYLGKTFAYGSLDFTPLLVNEVLPDGHEKVITRGMNLGVSETHTDSSSAAETRTHPDSHHPPTGESIQLAVSRALSASASEGRSSGETEGWSESHTDGASHARSRGSSLAETTGWSSAETRAAGETERRGRVTGSSQAVARTEGRSGSRTVGQSESETDTTSASDTRGTSGSVSQGRSSQQSRGQTDTRGLSLGRSAGESHGTSDGRSVGRTSGESDTAGVSAGVSFNETYLAKHRINAVASGKLLTSVPDQIAQVMNRLASLPDRRALVKCKGLGVPFLVDVHEVRDPWSERQLIRTPRWKEMEVERFLEQIHAAHRYYFAPEQSEVEVGLADNPPAAGSGGRARLSLEAPEEKEIPFED